MTAGKGWLVNDGHIFDSFWDHSHKKGRLVNDGHILDGFWDHSHTSTAPLNHGSIKSRLLKVAAPNPQP